MVHKHPVFWWLISTTVIIPAVVFGLFVGFIINWFRKAFRVPPATRVGGPGNVAFVLDLRFLLHVLSQL